MLNYNIWITKMGNIKQHHCVPKLMTQSQMIDVFIEYVLTLRSHLPGNGMVRYTLFKSTGHTLIFYACPRDVNKL